LKKHGYPMTLEGRKQFIDDQLSKGAI